MFSFVIPTYNREQNLKLVLQALCLQTEQRFEVIVADDGSMDQTGQLVKEFAEQLRLKYYWHTHDDHRPGFTRNQGSRLRAKDTTHIWFLDSDILLSREAVSCAYKLIQENPTAVISGRYDYLRPMNLPDTLEQGQWEKLANSAILRIDHRHSPIFDDKTVHKKYGCVMLAGNLIVPVVWLSRGFDEAIRGRGEDGEFSYHLNSLGAPLIFSEVIKGLHLYHEIDLAWRKQGDSEAVSLIRQRYNLV